MNDADNTQDRGLTTEQIAAASRAPAQEAIPAPAGRPGDGGSIAADSGSHASLLDDGELQNMTMRWRDIQAEFVDEPATAVREADALVAELMQRLATMFATERAELENRWPAAIRSPPKNSGRGCASTARSSSGCSPRSRLSSHPPAPPTITLQGLPGHHHALDLVSTDSAPLSRASLLLNFLSRCF